MFGVGCLYKLVMSVSTCLKYFWRGGYEYSGGSHSDLTLNTGIVLFWSNLKWYCNSILLLNCKKLLTAVWTVSGLGVGMNFKPLLSTLICGSVRVLLLRFTIKSGVESVCVILFCRVL